MQIRVKLVLNTILIVILTASIVVAGVVAMGRIQEKVTYLTSRSTPYQTRTIEAQRAIQAAVASLTKVGSVAGRGGIHDCPRGSGKGPPGGESCLRCPEEPVQRRTPAPSEDDVLAAEIFKTTEGRLRAVDAAVQSNRTVSETLKEVSGEIANLDNMIRALQLNRHGTFQTLMEEAKDLETLKSSSVLTQANIATNILIGNSELVSLGSTIEAAAARLFTTATHQEIKAVEAELTSHFAAATPILELIEKMLRKLDAKDEQKLVASVKHDMESARRIAGLRRGDHPDRLTRRHGGGGRKTSEKVTAFVAAQVVAGRKTVTLAQGEQEATVAEVNRVVTRSSSGILALGGLALLLGIVFSGLLARSIARPMRELTVLTERFGGKGTFPPGWINAARTSSESWPITSTRRMEKIGEMVGQLASASENLAAGSEELSGNIGGHQSRCRRDFRHGDTKFREHPPDPQSHGRGQRGDRDVESLHGRARRAMKEIAAVTAEAQKIVRPSTRLR